MIELSENATRIVSLLTARHGDGANIDDQIQFMHDSGLTFLDCMKVVVVLTGCTIDEAKRRVHRNPAWVDEKFEREAIIDRLIDDAKLTFGSDERGENAE